MNKNLLVGVGLVLVGVGLAVALVLGFFGATKPAQVQKETIVRELAGISSPDVPSPYFGWGDVRNWASRPSALLTATTTVCQLVSPVSTSSIRIIGIDFQVSTTSATVVTIATSTAGTLNTATTTSLQAFNLSASESDVFVYVGKTGDVLKPSTPINISLSGGIGTYSPTGSCQAVFTQLSY